MTSPRPAGRRVVMVHGGFCGGWVFDAFKRPFEAAGHAVETPDLPGHETPRARPVHGRSMADYARHVADLCAQGQPPVLVGHSMGGLVALMAAARAPAAALVLLAPSPPWGVPGSTLDEAASAAGLHALGAFWLQGVEPDYALACGYSLDRLAPEARRGVFDQMTAESGLALFQTLNWWLDPMMTTAVPPLTAPILVLTGGRDHIHPPVTVGLTATRLGAQLRVFEEMSHWLPAEPGWEGVAQAALDWLAETLRPAA